MQHVIQHVIQQYTHFGNNTIIIFVYTKSEGSKKIYAKQYDAHVKKLYYKVWTRKKKEAIRKRVRNNAKEQYGGRDSVSVCSKLTRSTTHRQDMRHFNFDLHFQL